MRTNAGYGQAKDQPRPTYFFACLNRVFSLEGHFPSPTDLSINGGPKSHPISTHQTFSSSKNVTSETNEMPPACTFLNCHGPSFFTSSLTKSLPTLVRSMPTDKTDTHNPTPSRPNLVVNRDIVFAALPVKTLLQQPFRALFFTLPLSFPFPAIFTSCLPKPSNRVREENRKG